MSCSADAVSTPSWLPLVRLKNCSIIAKIPSSSSTAEYRSRAAKPKVRTGCVVCKIRRVKCDERQPECLRCTSTGRKYEGYAPPRQKRAPTNVVTPTTALDTSIPAIVQFNTGTTGEKRALHVFCLVSRNDFSHHFEPASWTQLVLQSAHTYPTVRRALNAVGALYEAYLRDEHKTHRSQGVLDTPTSQHTLVEYTKAVSYLSQDLQARRLPKQAVLSCCLLFIWLEFLRNDFATALRHLRSGLSILLDMQKSSSSGLASLDTAYRAILSICARLQIQATVHGCPSSDFNSSTPECPFQLITNPVPAFFSSAMEACLYLDAKIISILQFIRRKQSFEREYGTDASCTFEWVELIVMRDTYLSDLGRWKATLEHSPSLATGRSTEEPTFARLEIDHLMAVIFLENLFSETEMSYDEHNADFIRLLSLSEYLLNNLVIDLSIPVLSLDSGVIPSLFYITLKCREPKTRRRALQLLRAAPDREGMWHRDTMCAASAWKVGMEEAWQVGQPGEEALADLTSEYELASQIEGCWILLVPAAA
ncbi:hypothetical protein AK830_g5431 [Neonectria ditissima]|uniref:Zn(2)-C6 fungal-type domain-containing protein n=1 Tax=Neonectria ditissima TaxID=78410 RepID=A0A0N8H795_9HYPO|nr:hypothetical protein AK830_g5431 [Neonectria ditissima]